MACDTWREHLKSRLQIPGCWARFLTLYTDVTSQYSDDPRPDWMATDMHRVEVIANGELDPIISLTVPKDVGNQMYKTLRKLTTIDEVRSWVDQMERIITTNGSKTRNCGIHGDIMRMEELNTCNA